MASLLTLKRLDNEKTFDDVERDITSIRMISVDDRSNEYTDKDRLIQRVYVLVRGGVLTFIMTFVLSNIFIIGKIFPSHRYETTGMIVLYGSVITYPILMYTIRWIDMNLQTVVCMSIVYILTLCIVIVSILYSNSDTMYYIVVVLIGISQSAHYAGQSIVSYTSHYLYRGSMSIHFASIPMMIVVQSSIGMIMKYHDIQDRYILIVNVGIGFILYVSAILLHSHVSSSPSYIYNRQRYIDEQSRLQDDGKHNKDDDTGRESIMNVMIYYIMIIVIHIAHTCVFPLVTSAFSPVNYNEGKWMSIIVIVGYCMMMIGTVSDISILSINSIQVMLICICMIYSVIAVSMYELMDISYRHTSWIYISIGTLVVCYQVGYSISYTICRSIDISHGKMSIYVVNSGIFLGRLIGLIIVLNFGYKN